MSIDDRKEIKAEYIEEALTTLENILEAMNSRCYDEIPDFIDETEWDDYEALGNTIDGYLEDENVDVYGAPCEFNPEYEYSQENFYTNDDGSGFTLDYDLTSDGHLIDVVLHLEFIYSDNGLIRKFIGIDA